MNTQVHPIGLVKGPGETPFAFTFVACDAERILKIGEFITYDVDVEGKRRQVLARITARRPLRLYPDSLLADPELSPDQIGIELGYGGQRPELLEFAAETIGYFDEEIKSFVNPRISPRLGSPVFRAENEFLSRVLSSHRKSETGSAHIGSLLSRRRDDVPIIVDLDAICSTHLGIIASTGAGKSYLAGVLIEEMLQSNNRAALLVVDPHGEYDTLMEMRAKLADGDFAPEVSVYKPGEVQVRIGSLSMADLRYLLPDLTDRMEYVLHLAAQRVQKDSRKNHSGEADRWTLEELKKAIQAIGKEKDPENGCSEEAEEGGKYKDSADAVLWRLNKALGKSVIFDDVKQTSLRELVHPGKCAVLQLSEVDARQQQVMVATLLRRIYEARVQTRKGQATLQDSHDFYLPYPVFVLLEEAHHFAPANSDAISTGILKQVLAEGRKFGVGVGLISQRPGKLDADVLSQCNTQFLLRIVNPVDQARVRDSVESIGQDLIDELPSLTKGQAIISGAAVNTPVICQIRRRITKHGAEDIPASREWMQWFDERQAGQRARDQAGVTMENPKSRVWKS